MTDPYKILATRKRYNSTPERKELRAQVLAKFGHRCAHSGISPQGIEVT